MNNKKLELAGTYSDFSRCNVPILVYIKPVPTQILTVFVEVANKSPVHIDIDSGATLNYVRLKEAQQHNADTHASLIWVENYVLGIFVT